MKRQLIDLTKVKVFPLEQRASEARVEEVIVDPASTPAQVDSHNEGLIRECVTRITAARKAGASIMLIYGAHLIKNGGADILIRLIEQGWVTHLATNGAGIIHDWEFSFLGRSTESVRKNVATGTFGTWDETGRNIHLALLTGGVEGRGFGESLGRFVHDDGATLPTATALEHLIRSEPAHPLTPARADLLQALQIHGLAAGRHEVRHAWKRHSVLDAAFRSNVALTVHPGIGYDIISNHPMFNGAVIGRAATIDFRLFGGAVQQLEGGVVMSVGSAIMGPQVFEKSLSCVNNLRIQQGNAIVQDHSIFVVDLQDGGNWDWRTGEPPKDNPAYYLRFCKSYARMGGAMHYLQCDNVQFLHQLVHQLTR